MDCLVLTWGYTGSIVVGGLLSKWVIDLLRADIGKRYPGVSKGPSVASLDWVVGGLERSVATTLVIWAPSQLPLFVGGWVALKFAANWQERKAGPEDWLAKNRLVALIGSVISLGVAIAAGLLIHPESAAGWATNSATR